ncbi:C4-dicarboxylate ABC transporter [Photobacterium profundum]|uniref:C4-dicarboxylate transporter n=1 Tax=Photobacterium profundum 3TCK TaxID=314280 RepID=Q1YYL0_9GAMM|nr:C4-dicarboxylate transporter DcuC [Photobacterium profundum]EAS41312.1 hypothetical protein P3TCK_07309 [Photobacterium profundum 3TCK]PSV57537.1 C4-dicarboxylate ABC transporter [Photobacterium profundum]
MSVLLLVLMFFSLMYKRKFIPFIFILSGVTVSLLNGNGLQQTALEFSSSFWNVILTIGLNIVTIVAFSEYVNKNGSTKELVSLVYKPVGKIKDRYLILAVFYLIGLLLSVVITSASALSMIFMSTVFPILVSKGISKDGAAAMITSIGVIEFGPLKSSTIYMAEEQNKHIYDYVMNEQVILFIGIAVVGAISHYFWQCYLDKRLGFIEDKSNKGDDFDSKHKVNMLVALLPLLPLFLILFERFFTDFNLPLWGVGVVCISVSLIIDLRMRKFSIKEQVLFFYNSVSNSFFFIVSIIIGGKFLVSTLPIENVVNIYSNMHLSTINPIVFSSVLVLIIVLSCTLLGSGTVSFITIVAIMSKLKLTSMTQFSSTFSSVQMISGVGRSISPISPTVLLCSNISQVSLFSIIIRNIVPAMSVTFFSIIYSNI